MEQFTERILQWFDAFSQDYPAIKMFRGMLAIQVRKITDTNRKDIAAELRRLADLADGRE